MSRYDGPFVSGIWEMSVNTSEKQMPDSKTADAPAAGEVKASGERRNGLIPAEGHLPAIPIAAGERVDSIDILRGFALLGVLLMNMQAFAMPLCAYMNPTSYGNNNSLSFSLWCINHVVADGKFITIFSMLFGAGIVLMTARARIRTGRSAWLHHGRMLWLLLFGSLHGVLLWCGDILLTYAICGFIVYWFSRRRPWLLVALSVVFLCIPAFLLANFHTYMENIPPEESQQILEMWAPSAETIVAKEAAYRGGYLDHLPERFKSWVSMFGFLMIFGWRVSGVMLLGMALLKLGVLSGTRSRRFYAALVLIGFVFGLPMVGYGIHHQASRGWDMVEGMGVGSLYNYFGSLLVAFAWIGVILLLCRSDRLTGLKERLAAVGRMAFTNYIMHSVLCTTLYYGHGFGFFGRVDRLGQLCIVFVIAALQLWYSPLWLRRFQFGPLEWLWRTLTYWQPQPFRRAPVG